MNKDVLRNLSYGVYVVTTNCKDRPVGCVANSIIQVSYDTVAVSINHDNFTNGCIKESEEFAISILGIDVPNPVIGTFGYRSCRDIDKFKDIESFKVDGLSIIKDAIGYITCDLVDMIEVETHTIFIGKFKNAEMIHEGEMPMTYAYFHAVRKGKSPKNAPTYIPPKE